MVKHIGFIMDGNRRYAKKQNLSLSQAYKKGMENFLNIIKLQIKYNVYETSFFALSKDNYNKRDKSEKAVLFNLIKEFSENKSFRNFFKKNKIQINIKGNEEIKKERKFDEEIKKVKTEYEKYNLEIGNPNFKVNIALNYDGQEEITKACNELIRKKRKNITSQDIKNEIWFNKSPEPNIIVRTGDAPRTSGFLLWDSQYSELYLSRVFWPEYNEEEFKKTLQWYSNIKRNFGK